MPGRRILVSPQGGGPVQLNGGPLPQAQQGVFYSTNMASAAQGGLPPYTFALLSATGPDAWTVNTAGVLSGTPVVEVSRVDNNGNYRVDNNLNVRGAFT